MNTITQIQALQDTRDLAASLLSELEGWESSTENLSEIFPEPVYILDVIRINPQRRV